MMSNEPNNKIGTWILYAFALSFTSFYYYILILPKYQNTMIQKIILPKYSLQQIRYFKNDNKLVFYYRIEKYYFGGKNHFWVISFPLVPESGSGYHRC